MSYGALFWARAMQMGYDVNNPEYTKEAQYAHANLGYPGNRANGCRMCPPDKN